MNKTIKNMIKDKDIDAISDYLNTVEAQKEGMVSMDSTILSHYRKGIITRETALDYAFDRKELQKAIDSLKVTAKK
jgi:twitching motility protein PilT